MNATSSCPYCGGPRTPTDRFCGSCGGDLTQAAAAPKQNQAKSNLNKTMLGVSPVATGGPFQSPTTAVEAPRAAEPTSKAHAKTMLGMVSPFARAEPAEAPSTPLDAASAHGANKGKNEPVHKKTMLGMSMVAQPESAAVIAKAAPGEVPGKPLTAAQAQAPSGRKQTTFGMSEEDSLGAAQTLSPDVPAPRGRVDKDVQTNRTMLGVPLGAVFPPKAAASAEPPSQAPDPVSFRQSAEPARQFAQAPTPDAAPKTPAGRTPAFEQPVRQFTRPDSKADSLSDITAVLPKQGGALRVALIALGLVMLLGAGYALFASRGPDLSVRVVGSEKADGTDLLEVDVPAKKPAAKVRFSGVERALEAGRARFPLSAEALRVGDNELAIDVIAPDGDVDTTRVTLHVAYRVRADVAALAMTPPAVDIVVDAVPGSRVVLDGTPLPLDASGHAIRRYIVPPQAGDVYALTARYRVEGEGGPTDGEVRLSLPVTSMQIDRPGPDAVTDQDAIEIAGAVENGANVSVGAVALSPSDGRFLYRAPLKSEGSFSFDVIARAPNKVPRQATVQVRRVHDMTMAAASFVADKSLTYARIAQNPNIYRGQRVSFDGRVYNVEVQGGRSVLQLLVRDCPGAQRCALWVDYGQATDATVDTWVRVLGHLAGEQEFQTKQGASQTVPSVNAQYVLRLLR